MRHLTLETKGQWIYVRGATFLWKSKLKEAGAKWSAREKAWYFADTNADLAQQTVAAINRG